VTPAPRRRLQTLRQLQDWRKECSEGSSRGLLLRVISETTQTTTTSRRRRSSSSVDSSASTGRSATQASQEASSLQAGEYLRAGMAYAYQPNGTLPVDPARFVDDLCGMGPSRRLPKAAPEDTALNGTVMAPHRGLEEEQAQVPARSWLAQLGARLARLPPQQSQLSTQVVLTLLWGQVLTTLRPLTSLQRGKHPSQGRGGRVIRREEEQQGCQP